MQEVLKYIDKSLEQLYSLSERKLISSLLIEKITGLKREIQFINKSTNFSEEQRAQLTCLIEKLKKNTPLQYVLGETEFFGLMFTVNESVLIPRPETEELVEWIIHDNKDKNNLTLLDIGTGSGCIAISVGYNLLFSEIDAIDISDKAIETAKKNSSINNIQVNFQQADIFNWQTNKKWDVIVSNPPYIPEDEKRDMESNVLLFEPSEALFVPNSQPLIFYEQIAVFAKNHLSKNGNLYFEIHYDKGQEIVELLKETGFKNIELKKDISQNDRMIKAELD